MLAKRQPQNTLFKICDADKAQETDGNWLYLPGKPGIGTVRLFRTFQLMEREEMLSMPVGIQKITFETTDAFRGNDEMSVNVNERFDVHTF